MLAIHALASQLKNQTLVDSQADTSTSNTDESGVKIRHHSEPHPPHSSLAVDPTKKVKIVAFHGGTGTGDANLSSILVAVPDTSSSWDFSSSNPPNKRQCRSMSIPNDGELHMRWLQTQARSRLHRPLALRPTSGGSRSKQHQRNSQNRTSHIWSSLAPSDYNTPPESPRSRPSSASSGFFESPLASSSNLIRNRCESLQALPSVSNGKSSHHTNESIDSHHRALSANSMPSVAAEAFQTSPQKQRLLRCQSQPCVAHERRCGVKRRHEDRPSINFDRMTETAFVKSGLSIPSKLCEFTAPVTIKPTTQCSFVFSERILQTIASSPQDVYTTNPVTSSSSSPTVREFNLPLTEFPATLNNDGNNEQASDSGCSTTDDEICDITEKAIESNNYSPSNELEPQGESKQKCLCRYANSPSHVDSIIFDMESTQDVEIDLDMIENN